MKCGRACRRKYRQCWTRNTRVFMWSTLPKLPANADWRRVLIPWCRWRSSTWRKFCRAIARWWSCKTPSRKATAAKVRIWLSVTGRRWRWPESRCSKCRYSRWAPAVQTARRSSPTPRRTSSKPSLPPCWRASAMPCRYPPCRQTVPGPWAPPAGKNAISPKRSLSGKKISVPSVTTALPPARTPPFVPKWLRRTRWRTPRHLCIRWTWNRAICAVRNMCCRSRRKTVPAATCALRFARRKIARTPRSKPSIWCRVWSTLKKRKWTMTSSSTCRKSIAASWNALISVLRSWSLRCLSTPAPVLAAVKRRISSCWPSCTVTVCWLPTPPAVHLFTAVTCPLRHIPPTRTAAGQRGLTRCLKITPSLVWASV